MELIPLFVLILGLTHNVGSKKSVHQQVKIFVYDPPTPTPPPVSEQTSTHSKSDYAELESSVKTSTTRTQITENVQPGNANSDEYDDLFIYDPPTSTPPPVSEQTSTHSKVEYAELESSVKTSTTCTQIAENAQPGNANSDEYGDYFEISDETSKTLEYADLDKVKRVFVNSDNTIDNCYQTVGYAGLEKRNQFSVNSSDNNYNKIHNDYDNQTVGHTDIEKVNNFFVNRDKETNTRNQTVKYAGHEKRNNFSVNNDHTNKTRIQIIGYADAGKSKSFKVFNLPVTNDNTTNLRNLSINISSIINPSRRIIGGEDVSSYSAAQEQFPYMVVFKKPHKKKYVSFCGGAILNERKILTAAHCFVATEKWFCGVFARNKPKKLSHLYAVLGSTNYEVERSAALTSESNYSQWRKLENMSYHRMYKFPEYDLAIVHVKEAFKKPYYTVLKPIEYELKNEEYEDSACVTVGHGDVDENGTKPYYLQKADSLEMMDSRNCTKRIRRISKLFHCMWTKKNSIGEGDGGGPLICDDKLVGIIVTRMSEGRGDVVIFTRVAKLFHFIMANIAAHRTLEFIFATNFICILIHFYFNTTT